jgi:hypothetical protein
LNKVPKHIIDEIIQRRKYKGKANKLTTDIDNYLKKNNIDFEYVCSHIALFCEPEMVEYELIKLLTDEAYEKEIAKTFYTPEEVRKMSPKEVRENYQQIMDSMRLWHDLY